MAEKNLIKIYVNATSAKRVDIIIRHYTVLWGLWWVYGRSSVHDRV